MRNISRHLLVLFFAGVLTSCVIVEEPGKKARPIGLITTPPSYYSTPKGRYLGEKYRATLDKLIERIVRNPTTSGLQFANNISSVGGIGFFTHSASRTPDERYLEVILGAPEVFDANLDFNAKFSRLFSVYGRELLSILLSDREIYKDDQVAGYGLNLSWRNTAGSGQRITLERGIVYLRKEKVSAFLRQEVPQDTLLADAAIFVMEEEGPTRLVSYVPREAKPDLRPPIQEETIAGRRPPESEAERPAPTVTAKLDEKDAAQKGEIAEKRKPSEPASEIAGRRGVDESARSSEAGIQTERPPKSSPVTMTPRPEGLPEKEARISRSLTGATDTTIGPRTPGERPPVVEKTPKAESPRQKRAEPQLALRQKSAESASPPQPSDSVPATNAEVPKAQAESPSAVPAISAKKVKKQVEPEGGAPQQKPEMAVPSPAAQKPSKEGIARAQREDQAEFRPKALSIEPKVAEAVPETSAKGVGESARPAKAARKESLAEERAAKAAKPEDPVKTPPRQELVRNEPTSEERVVQPKAVAKPKPASPQPDVEPKPATPITKSQTRSETKPAQHDPPTPVPSPEKEQAREKRAPAQLALKERLPERAPRAILRESKRDLTHAKPDAEIGPSVPAAKTAPVIQRPAHGESTEERVGEQVALRRKLPEITPETGPVPERPTAKGLQGYIVQIAFTGKDEAQRWAETFERQGHVISMTVAGAGSPIRLRIGSFATRESADKKLLDLRQQGLRGIVLHLPETYRPEVSPSPPRESGGGAPGQAKALSEVPSRVPDREVSRPATGGYVIQLLFSDKAAAQKWAQQLEERGHQISMTTTGRDNEVRLRVGSFASRVQADQELEKLRQRGASGLVLQVGPTD